MKIDRVSLIMIVAWVIAIVLMVIISCVPTRPPTVIPPVPPEIQTVIKNISWIQGILIIGVVGSIFACFNGAAKIGIPLLISSLVGYGLTSAMMFYAKLIAILSLVGGVTLCGYMIFIKHRALKEIIKGVQRYRDNSMLAELDGTLDLNQSKLTKKLVKKVKEKINDSS